MKESLRQIENNHCIHTKNINSLLDLDKQDVMYGFLINHEKKCAQCSLSLKKFQEANLAAKVFVPKPFMPNDLRETYTGELSELFKIAGLNELENQKQKFKDGLRNVDKMGEDFINNLSSKTMMKAYAVAALLFVGLKFIF